MGKKSLKKQGKKSDFIVTEKRKAVWKIELELLEKFISICEKYDLNYFLIGGSMIGAVRHHGIIPWDDDIDVSLMREDYNKFLEVASKELPEDMFLQSPYTDCLFRGHAQLRKMGTTAVLCNALNFNYNQGIFLDIFPWDEYPKGEFRKKVQHGKMNFIARILENYFVPEHHSFMGKAMYFVFSKPCVCIFGVPRIYRCYEKICSKYNGKGDGNFSNLSYIYGPEKYMARREELQEFISVPFEHLSVMIPASYDALLKRAYGDYMVAHQVSSSHGDVLFDPNKSYDVFLEEYHEGKIKLEDYYLD